MGTASLEFLGFSLAIVVVSNLGRAVWWRQLILLAASFAFLFFLSKHPANWIPLGCFLAGGFVSLRLIQSGFVKSGVAPILIGVICAFVWLKRYSFVPAPLFLPVPYLTLGLSYIFFRVLHLIIDASHGDIDEQVGIVSYLNYTLNFTTFISGPIQRYQDFSRDQHAPKPIELGAITIGNALERIIKGFFKVNVLSLVLSMQQTKALNGLIPTLSWEARLLYGIVIVAFYPLYLYCNFSGYIDMVIGIARLLRIELPENFDRPFSSGNFMIFWSRWHITLSDWLKTYVYNPLLMATMRRYRSRRIMPYLGAFAIFVTFFLVGLWHGQTTEFIFFGLLQGGGVATVQLYQQFMNQKLGKARYKELCRNALYHSASRGLTFTWFAFTLLWFWSNWTQIGDIYHKLGAPLAVAVLVSIFAVATVFLELWEGARNAILGIRMGGEPLVFSRYTRTVWNTAMAFVTISVIALLNAPAPDLVYKAF